MRGDDERSGWLFSYVDLEARVRKDQPLMGACRSRCPSIMSIISSFEKAARRTLTTGSYAFRTSRPAFGAGDGRRHRVFFVLIAEGDAPPHRDGALRLYFCHSCSGNIRLETEDVPENSLPLLVRSLMLALLEN